MKEKGLNFKMLAIFKKEFKRLFLSPVFCFSLLCMFAIQLATMWSDYVKWFANLDFVIVVFVIGFGVGLISKEFKQKTHKLLFSAPVRTSSIILGKFLALFATFVIAVTILFLIRFSVGVFFGQRFLVQEIILGFFAVLFLVALMSAVVLFFSSCGSKTGVISGICYTGFLLVILFGKEVLSTYGVYNGWFLFLYGLIFDFSKPYYKLLFGVFSLYSVFYFVTVTLGCLYLSKRYLDLKR